MNQVAKHYTTAVTEDEYDAVNISVLTQYSMQGQCDPLLLTSVQHLLT